MMFSACGNSKIEKIIENEVKSNAQFYYLRLNYLGWNKGGVALMESEAEIDEIKKLSETQYKVSGTMIVTDLKSAKWINSFSCDVTYNAEEEKCGDIGNYSVKGSWERQ